MKPITGLDATFLHIESPTSPMHVGSVAIIEGSLEYETYKKVIKSRIHRVPNLRKRLVRIPMSLDYPYWVDDPHFNIDLHIPRVALPKPGGWQELRDMASQIFTEPLDPSRPLWSFVFVEGLDNIPQVPTGSVAIISKIHHVAIDGIAGTGIMSMLFDASPEERELPPPKPWKPEPFPNDISLLFKSAQSFIKRPLKLPSILASTITATVKTGFVTRAQKMELPTVPFTAPATPLNGIISAQRKWNTAILSLDRVKAIKKIMGTTLNDVVLAICAGALRRYLKQKGQLPRKPLVAMIPVSVRVKDDGQTEGNKIAIMLIQLASNIEDPIERLEVIHENTIRGKTYQKAIGAKTLSELAEVLPFTIAHQATKLYTRYHMARLHSPAVNVVITNVPGPQIPLYFQGHKLLNVMGMAPIIDGMGLIITVFSYNGMITLSSTSDANSMPDLNVFSKYLRECANELEAEVHKRRSPVRKKVTNGQMHAKSDALFTHLKRYLKNHPDFIKPDSGTFQFNIKGPQPGSWQLFFNNPPGTIRRGKAKKPDVTLTIDDKHLMRIAKGDLNLQTAFVQGRIAIEGDTKKAMRLAKILSLVPPLS